MAGAGEGGVEDVGGYVARGVGGGVPAGEFDVAEAVEGEAGGVVG